MLNANLTDQLYELLVSRKLTRVEGSYTVQLFKKGLDKILAKIGEEAVEVILAAKGQGTQRTVEEIADLFFHTLVLMAEQGISPEQIRAEMQNRFKLADKK